jgi:hypothetical protein
VSYESLDKYIQRCVEIPSKSSAFSSVRSVTVQGTLLQHSPTIGAPRSDLELCCIISPCLLDILHRVIPRCRLHIMTFNLPSLIYDEIPLYINQYEYQLATSSSLSSILVPVPQINLEGVPDFNAKAAIELANGLASNLSQAHIWWRNQWD